MCADVQNNECGQFTEEKVTAQWNCCSALLAMFEMCFVCAVCSVCKVGGLCSLCCVHTVHCAWWVGGWGERVGLGAGVSGGLPGMKYCSAPQCIAHSNGIYKCTKLRGPINHELHCVCKRGSNATIGSQWPEDSCNSFKSAACQLAIENVETLGKT